MRERLKNIADLSSSKKKEYNKKKDFNSLEAWNACRKVKLFFYKDVLPRLPAEKKFNLALQIRKSSISITSNIAEGY